MKKIILAIAVAALASMAVASFASAGVDRYQAATETLAVSLSNGTTHTFQITSNTCDGSFSSFTGTGTSMQPQYGVNATENIQGTLNNGQLSFNAQYTGDAATLAQYPGYAWGAINGAGFDNAGSATGSFTVTGVTVSHVGQTSFKNHGDYVSQGGDPHSCIGMPIGA